MEKNTIQVAITALSQEIAKNPSCATLYMERGRLYRMLGKQPEAMADLRKALLLDPSLLKGTDPDGTFSVPVGGCK